MPYEGMKLSRRDFLAGCAIGGTLAAMSGEAQTPVKKRRPNIIYILADDLGYGDVGCYGQKMIQTPNIDRLAAEGMRFTDHYAGSTVCAPSRCCLMTGLHTGHSYIRGNKQTGREGQEPIPASTVTVAELLKSAGYSTALIGKWGLGGPGTEGHPNKQGFDYFYGYLCQGHAHNYYPEYLYRNSEKVTLEGNRVKEAANYVGAGVAYERTQYTHDLFIKEALTFLDRQDDNPFFLYLALTIPHANNEAGKEGMEVPSNEPYSDKPWPEQENNHAAMITRMDRDIGRLMARLKERGVDDSTVVIFTSDNGPHREGGADPEFFDSNGPLRGIKRDLYEGGIRVPLIVRWPGMIAPGTTTGHVSAFWDFMPTAAELAGITTPDKIDGISYLPCLLGKRQPTHDYLYWEFHEGQASKQAVRTGNWKGVKNALSKPLELYDLSADIGEENDISSSHAAIAASVETIISKARTESKLWPLFEK